MVVKSNSKANEAKKSEQAKAAKSKNGTPTIEELKKENDALKAKLKAKPKSLDEQIEYYKQKKLKVVHLDLFKEKRKDLEDALNKIVVSRSDGHGLQDFHNENFTLVIESHSQYSRGDAVVKISNDIILMDAISFIIKKSDEKIEALEAEIMND